jgi:hypothetical protein
MTTFDDLDPNALADPPAKMPPIESESSSWMMTRKMRRRQTRTKRTRSSTAKKPMVTTPEKQD